jgi:hypothetical protein
MESTSTCSIPIDLLVETGLLKLLVNLDQKLKHIPGG